MWVKIDEALGGGDGNPRQTTKPVLSKSKRNSMIIEYLFNSSEEENDREASKGSHEAQDYGDDNDDDPSSSTRKRALDRKSVIRELCLNWSNPNILSDEDGCCDPPSARRTRPSAVMSKRKLNLKSKHNILSRQDGTDDDDDDDDDGLFITQKSGPKTSKGRHALFCDVLFERRKQTMIKARKLNFPFLANWKRTSRHHQFSHQDTGLNSCLMEGFFSCVQKLTIYNRERIELQAPCLDEKDIPPLSESTESSDEEIKVVRKSCFVVPPKAKPTDATARKAKSVDEETSHPLDSDSSLNIGGKDCPMSSMTAAPGEPTDRNVTTSPLFSPAEEDTDSEWDTDAQVAEKGRLQWKPVMGNGIRENHDPQQSPPNATADAQEVTLSQEGVKGREDGPCLNRKSLISGDMALQDSITLHQEHFVKKAKKGKNMRTTEENENADSDVRAEDDSGSSNTKMCKREKKKKKKKRRKERNVHEEKTLESALVVDDDDDDATHKKKKKKRKIREVCEEEVSPSIKVGSDDDDKIHKKKKKSKKEQTDNDDTAIVEEFTAIKKKRKKSNILSQPELSGDEAQPDDVSQMAKKKRNISAAQCDDSLSTEERNKKRASSFLAADEEEDIIELELPLPPIAPETQVSTFVGSAEFTNTGKKKKKKKKKNKWSAEEREEVRNEIEFEEAVGVMETGLENRHEGEDERLPSVETVETSEGDGQMLVKKKCRKKKKPTCESQE